MGPHAQRIARQSTSGLKDGLGSKRPSAGLCHGPSEVWKMKRAAQGSRRFRNYYGDCPACVFGLLPAETGARGRVQSPEADRHSRGNLDRHRLWPHAIEFDHGLHPTRTGTRYCCSGRRLRCCYGTKPGAPRNCCSTRRPAHTALCRYKDHTTAACGNLENFAGGFAAVKGKGKRVKGRVYSPRHRKPIRRNRFVGRYPSRSEARTPDGL